MSDEDEDRDEDGEDEAVLDSQDFIQEEYDLKLLISVIVTRIDHKSIIKYLQKPDDLHLQEQNRYKDEYQFFTENFRAIFNQRSLVLDDIIRNKLQPQVREYLKVIIQSKRVQLDGSNNVTNPAFEKDKLDCDLENIIEHGANQSTSQDSGAQQKQGYLSQNPSDVEALGMSRKILKVKRRVN